MDMIKTQQMSASTIEKVVVHPLVLRNIVDNHNRLVKDSGKRVVGALLGSISRGIVGVTNSYAVPFEEDDKDPSIWSFDSKHHESMFGMFKGLNAKEDVVGWYSTCAKLRENDLAVHALFSGYVPNPVLVTIDVQPQELGIPAKAYHAVNSSLGSSKKTFVHVSTDIAPPQIGGSVMVTEMTPGGENGLVDFLEDYYTHVKNSVRISVSGYDTSLDIVELVGYLEKHFESCGLEDIRVPTHPVTGAIISSSATLVLRGEGVVDKALALNGSYVGRWKVSVTILPPELDVMSTDMTAREFALGYAAAENPF
ncbi:unnamed protein product [Eruca vesicaria subsp. sativa]|uniref:MPN domain-containing protein n=1 Tax=Eruca vesicaria subsp. sativa TaxID=29727 RepID=A0ABC8IRQ4_ERUVS|nr:unnamed protein product [Eruca vesicaria subsp. sativa]